jgi:hypothetical protein
MSRYLDNNLEVIPGWVELGGGVQFWAIVSPIMLLNHKDAK